MQFRVVTLNLEQDHKRWRERQRLISAEIAALKPDVIAFNEVSVPLQTAKILRDAAIASTGIRSCPQGWCKSVGVIALSGRGGRQHQAATAGNLTIGSSLNGAIVSSVI